MSDIGPSAYPQLSLFPERLPAHKQAARTTDLRADLAGFHFEGKPTLQTEATISTGRFGPVQVPIFTNEFWTAKQRQANALHEISYRACFKPQLPRFFIERLTAPGELVYDPFMGRGTTLLEAALLHRIPCGCDINPLSRLLLKPRLNPPSLTQVAERLDQIDFTAQANAPQELLVFFHPQTLSALAALRQYLIGRRDTGRLDPVDEWLWLISINRLTGHSNGFFSVYTLPPNQAVSVKSQRRINERRNQTPTPRDIPALILKKSRILLSDCDAATRARLQHVAPLATLLTEPASATPQLRTGSVSLVVTSPPFLDIVDYATDNWLRGWFAGVDPKQVKLTVPKKLDQWETEMTKVFAELARVLKPGGHIAFEVGEVHKGGTRLEESVIPCGMAAGLRPLLVLINSQKFTKTANCWGVDNMSKGTNTNRIVVFSK